jgi:hypothetical protein
MKPTKETTPMLNEELKQLKQEKEFLLNQLFKVQEMLERYCFENHELQQTARNLEDEKNALKDENSRLIELIDRTHAAIRSTKPKRSKSRLSELIDSKKGSARDLQEQVSLVEDSPYFDSRWYLIHNPDVAVNNLSAAEHYLLHGGAEGRAPSINFCSASYLQDYPDVAEGKMNPLVHYLKFGIAEGRKIKSPEIVLACLLEDKGNS